MIKFKQYINENNNSDLKPDLVGFCVTSDQFEKKDWEDIIDEMDLLPKSKDPKVIKNAEDLDKLSGFDDINAVEVGVKRLFFYRVNSNIELGNKDMKDIVYIIKYNRNENKALLEFYFINNEFFFLDRRVGSYFDIRTYTKSFPADSIEQEKSIKNDLKDSLNHYDFWNNDTKRKYSHFKLAGKFGVFDEEV